MAFRYTLGTSTSRGQLALFVAVQLAMTTFMISVQVVGRFWIDIFPPPPALSMVYVLWTVGVVGSMVLGIARYRLYDVRVVIRRAALNTTATILLSGVFVAVYLAISAVLSETLNLNSYRWIAVVAAVSVVLIIDPLRRRLVSQVDNRLLGDRSRPLRAFARLQPDPQTDRDATTYDSILQALVTAVRAPGAALALRQGSEVRTVANHGIPGEEPMILPVSYRGELLGQVHLGRRTPGEEYPEVDRVLLEQLVAQAAAQIYGVRRDQELAQTRREALTAIADERGRLGRDLHDGLAPLLAGAGLTAEALRLDLTPGSPGERDAALLAERLRHAAGEVRNIAHGLDPGELNHNLSEAVTSYIDSLTGPNLPKFTAHIDVHELSPVVANAAYLVVLEAVNNAIRHAAAHTVQIDFRREGDHLLLCIADDGRGIPWPYVSGLGITSMRKRVQALGGRFTIGAATTGGTLIEASISNAP
jgi:signal transduction histidine kinase